jgi:osmotically-inducible protein OsmY
MTRNKRQSIALALAAVSLAGVLSACAPLIVGGAAMSALIAVDRRTSGAQLEDESIELRGGSRLRDALGDRAHVDITSYNRQVLLTGEVPSEQAKQNAEQVISRVDNVKGIVNELAVLAPSTLVQRSSDALVTGKVKASLVDARELYVGAFKVVTERGVVYLMGRVTQHEADRATQLARTISGVTRVVRIFEIISEEELRRMATVKPAPVTTQTPAAPAAAPEPAPVPAPPPAPVPQPEPVTTAPTTTPSVTGQPLPPAK